MTAPTRRGPGLSWSWSAALLGAVSAVPAAVAMASDLSRGLALAVGVLPAAIVGIAPARRRRVLVVALGALVGCSMFVGSVLRGVPTLAVLGIFALAVASAELAQRRPFGRVVMTLALPLVGIGLSYADVGEAFASMLLIIGGSIFAWVVSLLWPERPAPPTPPAGPVVPLLGYGIRLGLAGATAAAIGFLLDLDHIGWACAAALLVMRPSAEMQRLRSVGRIVAVVAGAAAAVVLAQVTSSALVFAVFAVVVVAGAAATHGSRWYVTPAFTTALVLSMLIQADPDQAGARFLERTGETVLGVALAYVFGLLVPAVWRRVRTPASDPSVAPGR